MLSDVSTNPLNLLALDNQKLLEEVGLLAARLQQSWW
jgi:hypothetical protein